MREWGREMLEIAGGILLALAVLALLPFMLRSIGGIIALVPVLLIGAFFLFTELGRTLLPIAVAIGVFGGGILAVDRYLDYRDAKRTR